MGARWRAHRDDEERSRRSERRRQAAGPTRTSTRSRRSRSTTSSSPTTRCRPRAARSPTPPAPAGWCCARRRSRTTSSRAGRPVPSCRSRHTPSTGREWRRHRATDLLRLQRRSGLVLGLAAHGPARPAPGRRRRRRRPHPAAVPARRQPRDPARGLRPGLHRPDVDRAQPRGRGREGQGLPRLRQGRRAGHRADPPVVHARGPLDVAEVRHRRVLRHRPRGRRSPSGCRASTRWH